MHGMARWSLFAVLVAAGCGARTLAGDEGPDDGRAPVTDVAAPTTTTPPAPPPPPPDDAAGTPFTVCPSSPPAVDSPCDSPGLHCVYEAFNSCVVVACDGSGSWQASQEGC